MPRDVIMAIRPALAASIYSGEKCFEFRRVRVNIRSGDRVLIYESSPVSRLTGEFVVGRLVVGTPYQVTTLERNHASRDAVRIYLLGARRASAIEILCPRRWASAIALSRVSANLRAPQSYVFLSARHE